MAEVTGRLLLTVTIRDGEPEDVEDLAKALPGRLDDHRLTITSVTVLAPEDAMPGSPAGQELIRRAERIAELERQVVAALKARTGG